MRTLRPTEVGFASRRQGGAQQSQDQTAQGPPPLSGAVSIAGGALVGAADPQGNPWLTVTGQIWPLRHAEAQGPALREPGGRAHLKAPA